MSDKLKIDVSLNPNRDKGGVMYVSKGDEILLGPIPVLGRADSKLAKKVGNLDRNPILRYGNTPLGKYRIKAILPNGVGTSRPVSKFGAFGSIYMEPVGGQALEAKEIGLRDFLYMHSGGSVNNFNGLTATAGCLRMRSDDVRKLMEIIVLNKASDFSCSLEEKEVDIDIRGVNFSSELKEEYQDPPESSITEHTWGLPILKSFEHASEFVLPKLGTKNFSMIHFNSGDFYFGSVVHSEAGDLRLPNGHGVSWSKLKSTTIGENSFSKSLLDNPRVSKKESYDLREDWKNMLIHERPSFYVGSFKDGLANGEGYYFDQNGWTYKGEFVAGKFEGRGFLKKVNTSNQENWRKNIKFETMHPFPLRDFGDQYEGNFLKGQLHGVGVYQDSSRSIQVSGEWYEGKPIGSAEVNFQRLNSIQQQRVMRRAPIHSEVTVDNPYWDIDMLIEEARAEIQAEIQAEIEAERQRLIEELRAVEVDEAIEEAIEIEIDNEIGGIDLW